MKSHWLFGAFAILILLPTLTFAAHSTLNTDVWNPTSATFALKGPLVVCGAPVLFQSGTTVPNTATAGGTVTVNGRSVPTPPGCQNLCDLVAQIIQILYFMIAVGIWIIIPILFAWGGIKIMLARGNPAAASEARKILTGAVWGVVIMLCAWIIVATFVHFFNLSTYIPYFGNGASTCTIAS